MATVEVYRECCNTTYCFDTEERAIASHVDWHNFHYSKGRRDYRLDDNEQVIRPLTEVLATYMAELILERAKCNCGGAFTGIHLPACPAADPNAIEPGAGRSYLTGEECC